MKPQIGKEYLVKVNDDYLRSFGEVRCKIINISKNKLWIYLRSPYTSFWHKAKDIIFLETIHVKEKQQCLL
jgi:hypothetical protein